MDKDLSSANENPEPSADDKNISVTKVFLRILEVDFDYQKVYYLSIG